MTHEEIKMNCAEFEEIVHDLDRPGTRGLQLREGALVHAEFCSRCALLVTENESLDFGLHALALQDAERKASPAAEAAMLREFRRLNVKVAPRTIRWQFAVIGAAAIVLLALGITLRHQVDTSSHGETATGTAAPAIANSSAAPSLAADNASGIQRGQQTASQDDSEYATAFVPLPYADDLTAIEDGAVVRVVLSRSALTSLGLPMTEMGGAEQIPADLVVSDDGTPQAIRLVSPVNFE
jgi:hypothetical protein